MSEGAQSVVVCPSCTQALAAEVGNEARACPICGRLYLRRDYTWQLKDGLRARPRPLIGAAEYEEFAAARCERGMRDDYASFRPFNESSRLTDTLLDPLRKHLAPGSTVLVCWARTPWMACWLAGHLPEQRILAVWEGERGILGVDGYAYWFAGRDRPPNLELVFADLRLDWPFADDSIDCVHGLDTLHRYGVQHVFDEACRVARRNAPILFPHIHLADHEPDPYFERGCEIRTRADHETRFATDVGARRWWILPEARAFAALVHGDDPYAESFEDPSDYNACVFALPFGSPTPQDPPRRVEDSWRGLVNALLELEGPTARLRADEATSTLMRRHPVYARTVAAVSEAPLEADERAALNLFASRLEVGEVRQRLQLDDAKMVQLCERLSGRELVRIGPLPPRLLDVQGYFDGTRHRREAVDFGELWSWLPELYSDRCVLEYSDGSEFTMYELELLTGALASWILERSDAGDRIVVVTPPRPELFILAWAVLRCGRVLVPIDASLPPEAVNERVALARPALVVRAEGSADLRWDPPVEGARDDTEDFESLIARHLDVPTKAWPLIDPDADAVVLFTSGTTGRPKGVRLSQRSLLHTSYALSARFGWRSDDRLLCPESPHAMSGFRNPAIAALCSGVTIYISEAGPLNTMSVRRRLAVTEGACTISTTVPAEVQAWLELDAPPATRLRQIALTGYGCAEALRQRVVADLDVQVPVYYGLTETGGYCLVRDREVGNLGVADRAAIRVVDDGGSDIWSDAPGELLVCTAGQMNGYLEAAPPGAPRVERGWLYTGDLVRRLADGSIEHLGRKDRLIKLRNGECLDIAELEALCSDVEGVRHIRSQALPVGGGYALYVQACDAGDPLRRAVLAYITAKLGAGARPDAIHFDEAPS